MSILTGPEIVKRIREGAIIIDPFDESAVQPNSVDLRLGDTLLTYMKVTTSILEDAWEVLELRKKELVLDSRKKNETFENHIGEKGFVLYPGILYLGSTIEAAGATNLVPMIDTRSSTARNGMSCHLSAGLGETAWRYQWTLEITVVHPLRIYAGDRVCQVMFFETVGEVVPYSGKYVGQRGPVASRSFLDEVK